MAAVPTGVANIEVGDTKILCYGDSQSEVFDYVFYGHEGYVQFAEDRRVGWRSGWSTRGLGRADHVERMLGPLSELPVGTKHAVVILGFGSVDIEWNLSYKRSVLKQNVNTKAFLEEAVAALSAACDRIVAKGAELRARACGGPDVHIVLAFPAVPLPLSEGYMQRYETEGPDSVYDIISHAERSQLWSQFVKAATHRLTGSPTH